MSVTVQEFADAGEQAEALADAVAADLQAAITRKGRATLAVPGGTTPEAFLAALGHRPLDWERVGVTLTDERWVSLSDSRSNQALLARTLFTGPAAAAEFVPLYGATAEPADSLNAIAAALARIVLPLDVCVLGMGADGHTASLFPGALGLDRALDEAAAGPVMAIRAPGHEEMRVTLTAPALLGAARHYLLIRGPEKRAALERALGPGPVEAAPVRLVLRARPVTVFYAD